MAVTLEELEIKFNAQFGGLQTQLNGLKRQMVGVESVANKTSSAFSGLGKMVRTVFSVYVAKALFHFAKASLSMANDVVESENLFAESMQGMSDEARKWSESLRDSLGLNAYSLRKNIGTMNVMLKSMGIGSDEAYNMSKNLTQLSEDMASFYNTSSEEMFAKIAAGMTGETEALKRIGILVDENTIKQYAMASGIGAGTGALSAQEKVLARYGAIMEQTTAAQGDLARTINSPVNQIRILNNTLNQAQIALGQAFQPIQAAVLPILNSLAKAALVAANAINTFMRALTGFTGKNVAATGAAEKSAESQKGLKKSLDATAKSLKGAGGAAKQAAKDANVGLKAFDEINKIADEAASSGGGGGGGGLDQNKETEKNEGLKKALDEVNKAMSKAADWLKRVWKTAQPTRDAVVRLWEAFKNPGNITLDGLADLYDKFLKPIGEWAITKGLPEYFDMLSAAVNLVSTAIEAAKPGWDAFYNNTLVPFGAWAGDAILDALKWLKDALGQITEWIKANPETFSQIVKGVLSIVAAIALMAISTSFINGVKTAFEVLGAAITLFTTPKGAIGLLIAALIYCIANWDSVSAAAVSAWEWIKEKWTKASAWFNENVTEPVKKFFSDAWGKILSFVRKTWDEIVKAWNGASKWFNDSVLVPVRRFFSDIWGNILLFVRTTWTEIVNAWNGASQWFYDTVLDPVSRFFSDIWGKILGFVKLTWNEIVKAWNGASTWFYNTVIDPIKTKFDTAWTAISTKATEIYGAVQDAWEGLSKWFGDTIINPVRGAWESLMNFLGVKKTVEFEYNVTTVHKTVTSTGGREYGSRSGSLSAPKTTKPNRLEKFATGGVFKPNKPFLGILGDQKFGRNIEAPEGVLRDIFSSEIKSVIASADTPRNTSSANNYGSGDLNGAIKQAVDSAMNNFKVSLHIDGQEFGRMSIKHINSANRLAGTPLLEI